MSEDDDIISHSGKFGGAMKEGTTPFELARYIIRRKMKGERVELEAIDKTGEVLLLKGLTVFVAIMAAMDVKIDYNDVLELPEPPDNATLRQALTFSESLQRTLSQAPRPAMIALVHDVKDDHTHGDLRYFADLLDSEADKTPDRAKAFIKSRMDALERSMEESFLENNAFDLYHKGVTALGFDYGHGIATHVNFARDGAALPFTSPPLLPMQPKADAERMQKALDAIVHVDYPDHPPTSGLIKHDRKDGVYLIAPRHLITLAQELFSAGPGITQGGGIGT